MLAKDIMTKDVVTTKKDTPIEEIAKLMLKNRISGIPVVDNANHIIGIVSESDLIYKVKPMSPSLSYWQSPEKFEKEYWKITATNAEEIMTTDVITADEEQTVEELATLMIEKHIKRIPIAKSQKLVGIISRADVIKAILKAPAAPILRW